MTSSVPGINIVEKSQNNTFSQPNFYFQNRSEKSAFLKFFIFEIIFLPKKKMKLNFLLLIPIIYLLLPIVHCAPSQSGKEIAPQRSKIVMEK